MSKKRLNFSPLSIFHWNWNSFRNKKYLFVLELQTHEPDIVLLNEIKLSQSQANELLNLPGYSSVYKCRNSYGGGVAILIKNSLKFTQIFDLDHFNLEIVSIKISVKTNSSNLKELYIFSFYHPPDHKLPLNSLVFDHIQKNFENFILAGDLNSKLCSLGCNNTNQNGKILETILMNSRFLLVNDCTPTYHSKNHDYTSVLDYFIISSNLGPFINSFNVLDDDLSSDHFPIHLLLDFSICKTDLSNSVKFNYEKADWFKFQNELDKYALDLCLSSENIDLININITSLILKAAYVSIPSFSKKKFKKSFPKYILDLISERKKLKRLLKKKNLRLNFESLHNKCNILTNKFRFEVE